MLTLEQKQAVDAAVSGHNMLLCGQAGTGKSFTLKSIYRTLRNDGKRVALLCTTGMACLQFSDCDAKTVHRYDKTIVIIFMHYVIYQCNVLCHSSVLKLFIIHSHVIFPRPN